MCTTFRYEQKAVVWLRVVYEHVLRIIVLEAKMPCRSPVAVFPKPRRKKNNCVSLVTCVDLHGHCKIRTADCRLWLRTGY